jgi:hypothetical protein
MGSHITLSLRARVCHSNTRTHVRLLGPCFKTGRLRPFRQRRVCCRCFVCKYRYAVCKQSTHYTHIVNTSSRALPPPAHHIPRGYKTKWLPSPRIVWHTKAALTRACFDTPTALGGLRSPHTSRHVVHTAQCWPQSFPF